VTHSLVLRTVPETEVTKDIGENVFIRDLSADYKVFAFYYPSAMKNEELEAALRGLGDLTGKNLFVNIGKLNDPDFDRVVKMFEIDQYPVVVVTAIGALAGPEGATVSSFVRLDNSRILADPGRAVALLQEIYGLFLRGDIADAISKVEWRQRSEFVRAVAGAITRGLRALGGFVAERDLKISLVEGSFELVKSEA
jgi:hypothetical protein